MIKPQRNLYGFTIIELIVSIGILAIVGILLTTLVANMYKIYGRGQASVSLHGESDALQFRVASALRGTFQVISASANNLVVLSYYAPKDLTPTQVTMGQSGTSFTISSIQGVVSGSSYTYDPATTTSRIVSTHCDPSSANNLFQYYNENSDLLVSPIDVSAVHLIRLNALLISTEDPSKSSLASTMIELRNLKTNL